MNAPGSYKDTSAISIGVTVLTWAIDSIQDLASRHDAWLHVSKVCQRAADGVVERMKHEARLNNPRPEPKRPPSGTFAGVHAALEHAKAPTAKVDMGVILARIEAEEESKP